ncbi:hypothetical protein OH77DRAFT_1056876 [Trametes cingulata]|nr:hypothetical protein OH77DRAFT_1056876 [Trametes cingulata]
MRQQRAVFVDWEPQRCMCHCVRSGPSDLQVGVFTPAATHCTRHIYSSGPSRG